MKFSRVMLLLGSIIIGHSLYGNTNELLPCNLPFGSSTPGSIIMEDDIFVIIDTQNSSDPIDYVQIFKSGQLIKEDHSCNTVICTVDLRELHKAVYQVVVMTQNGNTFSETIDLQ